MVTVTVRGNDFSFKDVSSKGFCQGSGVSVRPKPSPGAADAHASDIWSYEGLGGSLEGLLSTPEFLSLV